MSSIPGTGVAMRFPDEERCYTCKGTKGMCGVCMCNVSAVCTYPCVRGCVMLRVCKGVSLYMCMC